MTEQDTSVTRSLARIRVWRRMYWTLLATVLIGLVAVFGLAPASWSIAAPLVYLLVCGSLIQYTDLLMRHLECPRCHQPFFRSEATIFGVSGQGWAYWARRCVNCGQTA